MKKPVWITASALISIASLIFSGCASTSDPGAAPKDGASPNEGKTAEAVKLRFSWWGSQVRNDITNKVTNMYKELHPNVTFEPSYTSFADYWNKLSAEAAANNLPDVIQHDYAYIAQYANKNLLLPLDDYVKSGILDLSGVDKAVVDLGMVNGKLYGIPIGVNARALTYDPELFKKAGVPLPTENWAWDDFMNASLTIKQKLGIYGAGSLPGELYEGFLHYLRQNGASLYARDGKKLGYSDDKLFTDFFGMDLQLTKAGALPVPAVRVEVKGVGDDLIVSGKSAMSGFVKHSNNIGEVTQFAKRPLALATYPKGANEKQPGLFIKPSMFLTVSAKTKNPEEAVKFLSYFVNDIEANKVLAAERGVPISKKVKEALKPLMSDENKMQFDYMDIVAKSSSPIDPPEPPGHAEVVDVLKNIQQQLLYEKITLPEAAKSFRTQAEAILGR